MHLVQVGVFSINYSIMISNLLTNYTNVKTFSSEGVFLLTSSLMKGKLKLWEKVVIFFRLR